MPSIYEDMTDVIERIRNLTVNESESDVAVFRSELIPIMTDLDELRARINDDMETDQNRIVELEEDVRKRDEEIRKLQANASKIVAKLGEMTLNEVKKTEENTSKEDILDFTDIIRKV